MVRGRLIRDEPPDSPQQSGGAARDERPAPVGVENDRGDERRRDDGADRRAGVDDAHGGRSLARRKPFSDCLGCRREPAALAGAEQESAERKRAKAGRKAMRGTGQRPRHHDHEEPAARAQAIDQDAATRVHQAVGGEERDLQPREVGIAERNFLLDGGDGDRERLPVEIADGNRDAEDESNAPAQRSDDVPPIGRDARKRAAARSSDRAAEINTCSVA